MNKAILTSVALLGAGLLSAATQIAGAQTVIAQAGAVRPGHEPGVGPSYPASGNASNIDPGDTRSVIAPRLPDPTNGRPAGPRALLRTAEQALAHRQTGAAQEALERAETRLLDRSTPQGMTADPSQDPMVGAITQARQALAHRDIEGARRIIGGALAANPGPDEAAADPVAAGDDVAHRRPRYRPRRLAAPPVASPDAPIQTKTY